MEDPKKRDDDDDIEFSGKPSTFQYVLMEQLRITTRSYGREMRGGYINSFEDKHGNIRETYIEDAREVFCNCCLCLSQLMIPKYDKLMEKFYNEFKPRIDELKKNFLENSSVKETIILGFDFYEDDKDKILLEKFRMKKLELHRELFVEINKLLGRKNWGELGGGDFS